MHALDKIQDGPVGFPALVYTHILLIIQPNANLGPAVKRDFTDVIKVPDELTLRQIIQVCLT